MGTRELREKYQASTAEQAVHRAIRAEIPGGAEALDALDQAVKRMRARPSGDAGLATDSIKRIVAMMEEDVRRRYGLPAQD